MSVWLRDYHMAVLLSSDGPFKGCTEKQHAERPLRPLRSNPPPEGLSELARRMTRGVRQGGVAIGGVFVGLLGVVLFLILVAGQAQQCGGAGSPTRRPAGTQTEAQVVRYLESQGFSAFGAAGIVGNLQQESTLNPLASGGGVAQWSPSWCAQMSAWVAVHRLSPTSMAGQLEYLMFDLHASYPQLVSELGSASSPGEAATMFETTYELCSGSVADEAGAEPDPHPPIRSRK